MADTLLPHLRVLEKKINIVQGEHRVDSDPRTVLTTILGSCIAACIWDGNAQIGGHESFSAAGR